MDPWNDTAIGKLISCVENKEIKKAESLCDNANQECDDIYGKINIKDGKSVLNLKIFIRSVQNGQPKSINSQLESSKKVFVRCVVPYLQEKKRTAANGLQPTSNNEIKTREDKPSESKTGIPRAQRNAGKQEQPTGTALHFQNIFDEQWHDAFEALTKSGISEKKAGAFLLEIVQRAFTFNKEEEERQLIEAQRCAYHIIKFGEMPQERSRATEIDRSPVADELRQYRYLLVDKAVPRAQTEFLSNTLKTVYNKYKSQGITPCKEIEHFVSMCVEVTWLMCADDPPIHMVFWDESDPFDEALYAPSTKTGTKIDYVLWPALLRYKKGPVLLKGIVETKK